VGKYDNINGVKILARDVKTSLLMRWRRRAKSGFVVFSWKKNFLFGDGNSEVFTFASGVPLTLVDSYAAAAVSTAFERKFKRKTVFWFSGNGGVDESEWLFSSYTLKPFGSEFEVFNKDLVSLLIFIFIFLFIPKWVLTFDENRRYNIPNHIIIPLQ